MLLYCSAEPRHQQEGPAGCERCLRQALSEAQEFPTPQEAISALVTKLETARVQLFRPPRRKLFSGARARQAPSGAVRLRELSSLEVALEIATVAAYNQSRPTRRGFPSEQGYHAFRSAHFVSAPPRSYYEIQAFLAGYDQPYLLSADHRTIAMLEQHRGDIAASVPADIQQLADRHTSTHDHGGRRGFSAEKLTRLSEWIRTSGALPRSVTTYRQESVAYSDYSPAAEAWRERINSLQPGDELCWDDRPVATSLDPGFTRLDRIGWGDSAEWSPEQRDVHFAIAATHGYYLGSATIYAHDEFELILAPGQRYRVTGIRQHTTNNMVGRHYGGRRNRLYIELAEVND